MIGVDTNVLVYAHRDEFDEHADARAALNGAFERGERIFVPLFVLTEFVRVVTHPKILRPPSLQQWSSLMSTLDAAGSTGNDVYDATIVATLFEQGVTSILTNDRRIARFRDMDVLAITA